jgi:hypothetical protein
MDASSVHLRRRAAGLRSAVPTFVMAPRVAEAQLDPLLIVKRTVPSTTTPQYRTHILMAVDMSLRMRRRQRDVLRSSRSGKPTAGVDTTLPSPAPPEILPRLQDVSVHRQRLAEFEASTIAVSDCSTATLWSSFCQEPPGGCQSGHRQAVGENSKSARFGLITMRQGSTRTIASGNDGQVGRRHRAVDERHRPAWILESNVVSVGRVAGGNWNAAARRRSRKSADSSTANTDIVDPEQDVHDERGDSTKFR